MPQGKGTYGSQRGRPKKVSKAKSKKSMKEEYLPLFTAILEAKKKVDANWMQKADKSIERRGTEGKCTPMTKPGCTGKARVLAKTFRKIARERKGQ